MSDIDYRDFAFSSEEETDEQKSSSDEDEDHNTDDDSDMDEYASFDTEVERYQYDQVRYQGIPNQRKYQIAKKTNKGEDQKKIKAGKQDKPQSTRKSAKQDKPKALPKSRKEQESQVEKPVEVSQAGEIRFDCEDNLWYTYHKGNDRIYISGKCIEGL